MAHSVKKSPATPINWRFRPICRFCLNVVTICLIGSHAIAGKLSDTNDTVSGDDDDGISLCLFCFLWSDHDDDVAYESDPGPTTRSECAWLSHPYALGSRGYAIVRKRHYEVMEDLKTGTLSRKFKKETLSPPNLSLTDGKTAAVTGRGGYWYDWDAVHTTDMRIAVDVASVLGVQFRWTEFYESIAPNPRVSETGIDTGNTEESLDTMGLFDLLFRIPLVTEHRGLFRLGVGGLLMHYDSGNHFGACLSGELRLFPLRPMVMGVDLQMGYIRNSAHIRADATIGAIVGPVEFFGGYQLQAFLGETDSVVYNGPGGGIRLWF